MDCKKVLLLPALLLGAVSLSEAGEKPQVWTEVRSPHFVVFTNSNAKQGRRIAEQFEQIRAVFKLLFSKARVDPGVAMRILAVKDEKSLRELLPTYWEQKGHMHPAGLFVSRQDGDYVALRLDVEGNRPYEVLYHEYIHLLVRLNFDRIPIWANEGLAEFWANTDIEEKEVTLGNFSLGRLRQLRESKLLPLEVLLTVDEHSSYYNEENKASIFYAESWALVHMLLLGENHARANQFSGYLSLILNKHMDSLEAARQSFGDLGQLAKQLSSYSSQPMFGYLKMRPPAQLQDKDFPSRELPTAESLAVRGDFYVHSERPVEARAMLEQAQALDPKLSAVQEAFGVLALHEGNQDKAGEYFTRAAELDPASYLAQYYAALVAVRGGSRGADLDQAEAQLKRAIELNPDFAESYSTLAHLYLVRDDKLEEALHLAQKAATLEPGNFGHWINIGYVLLRMKRTAEAKALGERIQSNLASTPADTMAVQAFLKQVESLAQYLQRQSDSQKRIGETEKPDSQGEAGGEAITLQHRPSSRAEPPAGPHVNALGKIETVSCKDFRLELTINSSGHLLSLHADNYYKLDFESVNWEAPPNFNPCKDLQGLEARVVYVASSGEKNTGVLLTVEIRASEQK